MMTSTPELSFDCKSHVHSAMLLESSGQHKTEETQKLEEFVARLEEERLKIDAFKRELPLCMQLLTNAMEASRQELESWRINQLEAKPVLEEFIPLKNTSSSEVKETNDGNINADHKANWMKSAQLWNQEKTLQCPPLTSDPKESDIELALDANQRINGGTLSSCGAAFPELALASSHKEEIENNKNSLETMRENSGKCGNSSVVEKEQVSGTAKTTQNHRKARRCWSPDLHRRFVNALHMLGGPKVATPKQIRELMKVDGLTNDEVKSHLQKYRLHTRSSSPNPHAGVTAATQLVVLGGLWVPPEYAAAAAHGGAPAAALYGAHAATTPQVSHPIYHAIAPPPPPPPMNQMQHRGIHPHQFHVYGKPPVTQRNSPLELDIQGGAGNPSESIEDGKSESSSWKADSGGENGGRRLEVEESKSNASFISLNS